MLKIELTLWMWLQRCAIAKGNCKEFCNSFKVAGYVRTLCCKYIEETMLCLKLLCAEHIQWTECCSLFGMPWALVQPALSLDGIFKYGLSWRPLPSSYIHCYNGTYPHVIPSFEGRFRKSTSEMCYNGIENIKISSVVTLFQWHTCPYGV